LDVFFLGEEIARIVVLPTHTREMRFSLHAHFAIFT